MVIRPKYIFKHITNIIAFKLSNNFSNINIFIKNKHVYGFFGLFV